ncbi:hypothetical protein [Dactylosporangium sp. NPDC050588]|uniref:hypothetical protein n=1 Tax=Dactylosporangium sp. NPDC050588 TaxID=3157211 RepID=UPI0033D7A402
MSRLVPAASLGSWAWLEAGVVSGDLLVPGDHARSWLFDTIKAERDGLATHRLVAVASDDRVPVRRAVFTLLDELCSLYPGGWPAVADGAEAALRDADLQVRCAAAALLVRTGEPDRVVAVLAASCDPVVRIALMQAMSRRDVAGYHAVAGCRATLYRLRSDSEPAVRLLAGVAAYRSDDPAAWPALDAAIRADVEAAADALAEPGLSCPQTPGEVWARALTGLDREQDCCAWAHRLTEPCERPQLRLDGIRMAVAAMRTWRAAPVRLTPMLTGIVEEHPSEGRSAALRALASSLTASRLGADSLAAVLDDPEVGAAAATALGCVGDHRAVPHLVRLMLAGSAEPRLAEAFRAVARAGADSQAPVAAGRRMLAAVPDSCAPELPMRVLAAFGPSAAAAVPELIARLEGAENDTPDWAFHVLGTIGPAAAAAVPHLRQYPTQGATSALLKITSDRAVAERYLAGHPEQLRRDRLAAQLLTWLAEHGGLTARQHRQLRSLFKTPGCAQVESAAALWLQEGPAATDELLAVLPQYLPDDVHGPKALLVFTAMGSHARPVLDRLDRFITSPRRAGPNISDDDTEMRTDERLLAATITARERIAG